MRILLRLRKESANLPITPAGQDAGKGMKNIGEVVESDIMPDISVSVETVKDSKLNEQHGNIYENKESALSGPAKSVNVNENAYSYAQDA